MRRRNQVTGETAGLSEEQTERRSSQEYIGGMAEKANKDEDDDDDDKDKGAKLNKLTLLDSVFLLGLKDSQVLYKYI
jgi:hypothetical protein